MAQMQVKRDPMRKTDERRLAAPRVDVYENEKEILIVADLPGVAKERLSIQVDADTLVIEGARTGEAAGAALATEYEKLDYRRSFNVPPGIDREKIEAELVLGVLKLKLPKAAALQPRKIPIRSA